MYTFVRVMINILTFNPPKKTKECQHLFCDMWDMRERRERVRCRNTFKLFHIWCHPPPGQHHHHQVIIITTNKSTLSSPSPKSSSPSSGQHYHHHHQVNIIIIIIIDIIITRSTLSSSPSSGQHHHHHHHIFHIWWTAPPPPTEFNSWLSKLVLHLRVVYFQNIMKNVKGRWSLPTCHVFFNLGFCSYISRNK